MYKTPQLEPAESNRESFIIYPLVSLAQHQVPRSQGNLVGLSAQPLLARLRLDGAAQVNSVAGDYSPSLFRRVSSSSVISPFDRFFG